LKYSQVVVASHKIINYPKVSSFEEGTFFNHYHTALKADTILIPTCARKLAYKHRELEKI
jgi:hypothetical protein